MEEASDIIGRSAPGFNFGVSLIGVCLALDLWRLFWDVGYPRISLHPLVVGQTFRTADIDLGHSMNTATPFPLCIIASLCCSSHGEAAWPGHESVAASARGRGTVGGGGGGWNRQMMRWYQRGTRGICISQER